ncbi:hypothetical protein G9A89_007560 [Geosiphon pyriformis]|nr:hypothetical protein G9A89_007560 [Geosiphon pyriformis]
METKSSPFLVSGAAAGSAWETIAKVNHLAVDCKVSSPLSLKAPKVFRTHFMSSVSYVKASAFLNSSEFLLLAAPVSSSIIIGNLLVSFQLASLKFDLVKLSALVESIVKPVGFLVKLFKHFINRDLVLSSKLGFKVNEIIIHLDSFSKIVDKLGREVVSLKKECYMEDIDMSGDSKHPVGLDNEVFFNLMFLWKHESIDIKVNALKTAE